MKATTLFRTASILLFAAAAGNTYGLLNFWHAVGAMPPIRFPLGHSGFSWAQVVLGMDVFCSFCILFGACLAWHLGGLAQTTPRAIGALGWLFFAYQLGGFYVSLIYLSGFVRILAAAIAICIGWAVWLSTGAHLRPRPRSVQAPQNEPLAE
jgi:hypothetical protein